MIELFDTIIIGTGQAGPPLANRLSDAGMRIAIIERSLFGNTCVNTGCVAARRFYLSDGVETPPCWLICRRRKASDYT